MTAAPLQAHSAGQRRAGGPDKLTNLVDYAASVEKDLVATLLSWRGDAFRRAVTDASGVVEEADFAHPRARELFIAARWLHREGLEPDIGTVKIACRHLGFREQLPEDLELLIGTAPAPASARRIAQEVRQCSLQRRAATAAESYARAALKGDLREMGLFMAELAPAVSELQSGIGDVTDLGPAVATLNWEELWAREELEHEWLAEPVIPTGRQVAIFSPGGQGKSLLTLEVAVAKALGRPIFNTGEEEPIDVVYIDMEMTRDDLKNRLEALGHGPETDLSRLHYFQLAGFSPFDTEAGGAELEWIVRRTGARFVVIDTMARVVQGEENDADTYRDFYRHTGSKLKALGVTLLRLDHQGKEKVRGQRGSSAKNDDVDLVWRLYVGDDETVTLEREKHRMDWVPERVVMRRNEEPTLHHEMAPTYYPPGTSTCAKDLDELEVPMGESVRMALRRLREADKGRRIEVVAAAIKYRRERTEGPVDKRGNTPGNTPSGDSGKHPDPWDEPI